MYTAKIQNKTIENGILTVNVEFTNGVTTLIEWCKPQDEGGLKYWVKARLDALNSASDIYSKYSDGSTVDVSSTVVSPVVQTQAEIDRDKWLKKYNKWVKIKTTLIDTGILTAADPTLVTLKGKVQSDYLPEYLDLI